MSQHAGHPTLDDAVAIIRDGGIVAFPTETVYGLGADATNADAVLKIYEAKSRPRFNPLIVHCADIEMVETLVDIPRDARPFLSFWPGPLTLVLPVRLEGPVAYVVTAGLETLGVRIPAHPLARELIARAGVPVAAPSANPSGGLSATTAEQVRQAFAERVPVLDGGACEAGLESTIIGFEFGKPVQLRPGAIPREELEAATGVRIETGEGRPVSAPGMLKSHYAPKAALRLNAEAPQQGEAYLGFGNLPTEWAGPAENLSPSGDLREAARNLFAHLHALDTSGAATIAVAPIPETGLGEAINDRLRRAAARD